MVAVWGIVIGFFAYAAIEAICGAARRRRVHWERRKLKALAELWKESNG